MPDDEERKETGGFATDEEPDSAFAASAKSILRHVHCTGSILQTGRIF